MSRIRAVHPGLASDEAYMSMSFATKAAWPLLWTECDDHGVFEWKPIVLKARIFPADAIDFAAILSELETLNCIARVEIDGKPYGLVRNFCKFQRAKNPSYRHNLAEENLQYVGLKPSSYPSPTPALPQPSGKVVTDVVVVVEERGDKSPLSEPVAEAPVRTRKKITYSESFEEFWSAYPVDGNMSKLETSIVWSKLAPESQDLAIAMIPAFREYCRKNPDYRPVHAVRYLRQRRFDGFAQAASQSSSAAKAPDSAAWGSMLSNWKRGAWSSYWGPAPDELGCKIPAEFITDWERALPISQRAAA